MGHGHELLDASRHWEARCPYTLHCFPWVVSCLVMDLSQATRTLARRWACILPTGHSGLCFQVCSTAARAWHAHQRMSICISMATMSPVPCTVSCPF